MSDLFFQAINYGVLAGNEKKDDEDTPNSEGEKAAETTN